jgi:hypothetical protein
VLLIGIMHPVAVLLIGIIVLLIGIMHPVAVLLIGIMHGQGGREGTCSCVMIGYIVIIGMMYRRKGGYLQHIYKQHT